jgi:hypothetical protein
MLATTESFSVNQYRFTEYALFELYKVPIMDQDSLDRIITWISASYIPDPDHIQPIIDAAWKEDFGTLSQLLKDWQPVSTTSAATAQVINHIEGAVIDALASIQNDEDATPIIERWRTKLGRVVAQYPVYPVSGLVRAVYFDHPVRRLRSLASPEFGKLAICIWK